MIEYFPGHTSIDLEKEKNSLKCPTWMRIGVQVVVDFATGYHLILEGWYFLPLKPEKLNKSHNGNKSYFINKIQPPFPNLTCFHTPKLKSHRLVAFFVVFFVIIYLDLPHKLTPLWFLSLRQQLIS